MTSQEFNTAYEARRLIAEGLVSEDALHAITGIRPEDLRSFLDEESRTGLTAEPQSLSGDQGTRLSILAAQLTEGMRVGNDDRLKAIFESLTIECRLTTQNIARLTGTAVDDLDTALRDPSSIPFETRYELAIKGSYLINAINQAHRR